MKTPHEPVNKQASMFLSRRKDCETIKEAIEGAVNHLLAGKLTEQMADVFSGEFGPDPWVTFQVTIRKDVRTPGAFSYSANTKVGHDLGCPVRLYGLRS
jgi:hypothetical protein